jgi:hypothetical protein
MLWLVKQQSTPATTRPIPHLLLSHHTVDADADTLVVVVANPDADDMPTQPVADPDAADNNQPKLLAHLGRPM